MPHLFPTHQGELAQVIDIEQFVRFSGRQYAPFGPKNFTRVPFGRVVACSYRNAAGRIPSSNRMLNHGREHDPEIDYLMTACQQARDHPSRIMRPLARGSRPMSTGWPRPQKRPEGRSEVDDMARGESGSDDSA